ncbi:uncharacterized protein LOC114132041 [Aphis gossypii]|uniref:uncharacterized protein LOC114132041 n=2 Tax=Aphis gossypii TaxID=80765 RepID=UPI002158B4B9|nr:uncharacterized protein LOC114132041 [Aphis gossypii]XP_050061859.1 uncharacterized protein LOC114132041 [Aphis gossypii]
MDFLFDPDVKSLYTLSLNQLCITMDETTLRSLLEQLQPSLCLEILWKTLCVDDFRSKIKVDKVSSGHEMALIMSNPTPFLSYSQLTIDKIEHHGASQQTEFIDNVNFSSFFNQELFFKLVEVTNLRDQLFTLFQICVQIKGFNFPLNFAQDWIASEILDINEKVERGLKLGVFLGDSGWLNESALVLSHTYKIITTKWMCHDQKLQLLKTLQCLTKWLIVLSYYHNFKDAKIVLRHMLHTIHIIKQIEEKTLCIAYACVAVSEYYFKLQQFDEAWSWGAKAILELHKNSGHLKVIVLSHGVKVCTVLNKLNIARMLKTQMNAFKEEISDYTLYHVLLNESHYFYTIYQQQHILPWLFRNHYILLDYSRNLFGYYNLHTAMIMVEYVTLRHAVRNGFLLKFIIDDTMRCLLQAINIMHKIGLPDDNMLLVKAYQMKTLVVQDLVVGLENEYPYSIGLNDFTERIERQNIKRESREMLRKAEIFHLNFLEKNLKSAIRNTLVTAHLHTYLGRFYIFQKNYSRSKELLFRALEIKKLLLGENHISFAQTLSVLARLHVTSNKFQEAEVLYLQVIKIYQNSLDGPHLELQLTILELMEIYKNLNNTEKWNRYSNYFTWLNKTYNEWLLELQSIGIDNNCKKEDFSLEKFKCILNKCNCN